MTRVSGLAKRVRALLKEGLADREEIVERIMDDLGPDELRELVRPVLAAQVALRLREFTRTLERRVFAGVTAVSRPRGTIVDDMRNLLASTFTFDEFGSRVTWGEATVEQHQSRAALLRRIADRSIESADRHEQAAQMISEAGVTCLADLYAQRAKQAA